MNRRGVAASNRIVAARGNRRQGEETPVTPALLAVAGANASQAGIVAVSTLKGVPPAAAEEVTRAV